MHVLGEVVKVRRLDTGDEREVIGVIMQSGAHPAKGLETRPLVALDLQCLDLVETEDKGMGAGQATKRKHGATGPSLGVLIRVRIARDHAESIEDALR